MAQPARGHVLPLAVRATAIRRLPLVARGLDKRVELPVGDARLHVSPPLALGHGGLGPHALEGRIERPHLLTVGIQLGRNRPELPDERPVYEAAHPEQDERERRHFDVRAEFGLTQFKLFVGQDLRAVVGLGNRREPQRRAFVPRQQEARLAHVRQRDSSRAAGDPVHARVDVGEKRRPHEPEERRDPHGKRRHQELHQDHLPHRDQRPEEHGQPQRDVAPPLDHHLEIRTCHALGADGEELSGRARHPDRRHHDRDPGRKGDPEIQ